MMNLLLAQARAAEKQKNNRGRCGRSFPWTVVAPTGSRPCRRLPIGATAGCQPALHSRRDLQPGSWSQCALKNVEAINISLLRSWRLQPNIEVSDSPPIAPEVPATRPTYLLRSKCLRHLFI